MWTPDTTTQSRLMGGQALAAGISGGTKSLADSIGAAMEQRKQENVRAKASETLFKSTPELQDALGMDEEQFKGLSSAEKNELVKSGIGKISLMESLARQAQQREAFNMQQMDYSRRQADELGFNRAVGEQMTGGKPPDISAVLGAAAQNNQLGSPQLDNLMNSLGRMQPNNLAMSFEEDPVTGSRFARQGNSVLPSGSNPAKMTTVTVTDPNTGLPVELPINPRTGTALLKPRAKAEGKVSPEFTKSLGELAMGIDDPKTGPAVKRGIKAMIDSAHTLKQLDTEQRDGLYAQFGLGSDGAAAAPAGVNMENELKQAQNAISQGRSREAVAKKFKERTGKDLPQ